MYTRSIGQRTSKHLIKNWLNEVTVFKEEDFDKYFQTVNDNILTIVHTLLCSLQCTVIVWETMNCQTVTPNSQARPLGCSMDQLKVYLLQPTIKKKLIYVYFFIELRLCMN